MSAIQATLSALRRLMRAPKAFERPKPFNVFSFKSQRDVDQWVCMTDKQALGGFSTAKAEFKPEGFVRFHGNLSTRTPEESKVVRSGFCLFRSRTLPATLFGQQTLDLHGHDALEFEVRGDGRAYIANLQMTALRDEDLFQAALYTRGGAHWQTIRIPLSKFLLTNRGYVQNEQTLINSEKIETMGFLLADKRDGPFELDIRHIRAITLAHDDTDMDRWGAKMKTSWARQPVTSSASSSEPSPSQRKAPTADASTK